MFEQFSTGILAGLIWVLAFGGCLLWASQRRPCLISFSVALADGDREEDPDTFWFLTIVYSLGALCCAALVLVSAISKEGS